MDEQRRARQRRDSPDDLALMAQLLTDRLRAGELVLQQVRLAAYAGDRHARDALGAASPEPADEGQEAWLGGLAEWGRPACARAALAIATATRDHVGPLRDDLARSVQTAIAAAEAAIERPGDEFARREARRTSEVLLDRAGHGADDDDPDRRRATPALRTAGYAAMIASTPMLNLVPEGLLACADAAPRDLDVVSRIRAALSPWALSPSWRSGDRRG